MTTGVLVFIILLLVTVFFAFVYGLFLYIRAYSRGKKDAQDNSPDWDIPAPTSIPVDSYAGMPQTQPQQEINTSKTISNPYQTVFISYRRKSSWMIARKLADDLRERGADTFLDVRDLDRGDFSENLQREIRERDHFVVVLVPDTLQSEWVVKETAFALEYGKNVVPVMANGFSMYNADIPEQIASLKTLNAVTLSDEYYEASVDKLARFINLKTESN